MTRAIIKTVGVALVATLPMLASAQLTANDSLTTNYKFRGQDQDTSKVKAVKPALQGGFDYTFGETGFYVGNWNSSVNWLSGNSLESDLYGGYKFKAGDVDLDVGLLTYIYPGNSAGNTTEVYGAATFGPVTAKYSHTLSKDYFAYAGPGMKGRNTGYLNLAWAHPLRDGLTLNASVGHTFMTSDVRAAGLPSYTDYSVGVAWDFMPKTTLTAAFVGADKSSSYGYVNKGKAILGVKYTF